MATPEKARVQPTVPAARKVEIIPSDPPLVDPDPLEVRPGDRVEWWSKAQDWAVEFDTGTPFRRIRHSPSRLVADHIPVSGPKEEHFKYTIYADGKSNDPIIIVKR